MEPAWRGGSGYPLQRSQELPWILGQPQQRDMAHPGMSALGSDASVHNVSPSAFVAAAESSPNSERRPLPPPGGRMYINPPKPRSDASQALLWSAGYMRPFTPPAAGGRNVECRILVVGDDGELRACGATLKHTLGASTTNLLKHIKVKHPKEAARCLESSKHSEVYKVKREQGGNHLAQVAKSQRTVQGKRGRGDNKPVRVSLERSLALYCTLGLHPLASTSETGFRSVMTAAYYPMEPPAFTEEDVYVVLMREHESLVRHIKKTMASQLKFIPFGPCASMQLHTWSAGGIPYTFAAMSASFVTPQYKWNRCGLAVHAFSAESFTSTGVAQWVRDVTAEYFGPGVEPSSVFLACTIGRGEPLSSALTALGISESLGCSILALDGVVRGSLSGPAATFVNRLLEVTEPFATPGASEGTHLAVQSALGACMAHAAADQSSLQNVLELMQRMLSSRSLLLQHAAENPCSPQLSQAEWHALQDAFGLLEACAEVDIGIRSLHPLPLSTSIGLFQELQQYLSEDVVFVPDLERDTEVDRLERHAAELHPIMWQMRMKISNGLRELNLGRARTKAETMACLLDPFCEQSGELIEAAEIPAAWADLEFEYCNVAVALSNLLADPKATEDDGPEETVGGYVKRRWKGTLKERKERRSALHGVTLEDRMRAELDSYRNMIQHREEGVDALDWWRERATGEVDPLAPPKPATNSHGYQALSLLAAQRHSVDPTVILALKLFDGARHRISELCAAEPISRVQMMMLLRFNKDILLRNSQ